MSRRRRPPRRRTGGAQAKAQARRSIAWPEVLGEATLLALVVAAPIVIDTKLHNICEIKDVVVGLGVALGLGLWLVASLARGRITWLPSRLNVTVLAFAVCAGGSVVYSRYRYATVSEFGRLAAHVALFWLALVSLRSLKQARRVIGAAALASVAVSIYGFFQAAGHDFESWSAPEGRIFSFMGNPTYLGGFLALVLPVVAAAAWPRSPKDHEEGERGRPWLNYGTSGFLFASAAAMALCLYFSVTIAVVLGMGVAAVVTLVLALVRGGRRAARAAIPAAIGVILVVSPVLYAGYRHLPEPQQQRVQQVLRFQDPYGEERRLHWRVAFDVFEERPIWGSGYGAFRIYSLEKMAPEWYLQSAGRSNQMLLPAYAHNEYLQVLAGMGVVGGAVFLALLVVGYGLAVRVALRHPVRQWALLGFGLTAGLTAFLFQNLFGVSFRQTGAVTFFWVWLAVVVLGTALIPAPGQESAGPRLREWRFRPMSVWGLLPVCLGVAFTLVLLSWVAIRPLMASRAVRLAQGHAAAGNFREAAELADRTVSLSPYSALGYYLAGYSWGQLGEHEKAIAANQRALALVPGNASVYYNLGVSYKEQGRFDEALASFQRATELMPTAYKHHAAAAEVLLQQGKLKEAEPHARAALELNPSDSGCYLLVAEILAKQGRVKEVVDVLKMAEERVPEDTNVKQQLAELLFRMGRDAEAAAVCEDWARGDPSSPLPHAALGLYYFNQTQYGEAVTHLLRAVELDPNQLRARLVLAVAYGRTGRVGEAARHLEYLVTRAGDTEEGRRAKSVLDKLAQGPAGRRAR